MIEILVSLCAFVGKTWDTAVVETATRYTIFFWGHIFTAAIVALATCTTLFLSTKVGDAEVKWVLRIVPIALMLMTIAVCGYEAFYDWASAETPTYTLIRNLAKWL